MASKKKSEAVGRAVPADVILSAAKDLDNANE